MDDISVSLYGIENIKAEYRIDSPTKLKHWGDGPWVMEPDEFYFEYKGYRCRILRIMAWDGENRDHLALGHLCGYVCIPENKGYDYESISDNIVTHGGITYNKQEEDGYWVGFDCGHSSDYTPSFEFLKKHGFLTEIKEIEEKWKKMCPNSPIWDRSYRTVDFCINECKEIVDQLEGMKNNGAQVG